MNQPPASNRIFIRLLFACLVLFTIAVVPKKIQRMRWKKAHTAQKVHDHGYWIDNKMLHFFDEPLAKSILEFLKQEQVLTLADFGAGAYGHYTKYFSKEGIPCEGFDGNPHSPHLSEGKVQIIDLSQSFDLNKKYDWILCLEVGEHIPSQFEKILIENIDKHTTQGVIISWAIEGQIGQHHVNCKNNDYIKRIFEKYGYYNDKKQEEIFRKQAHYGWFKNTLMVFRKRSDHLD